MQYRSHIAGRRGVRRPGVQAFGRSGVQGGWICGELIAALLIFTILLVAAMPLRRSARAATERARCESARQVIAAVLSQRLAEGKDGISATLPDPPRCPAGGAYLIRRVSGLPIRDTHGVLMQTGTTYITCSVEGHRPLAVAPPPPRP